MGSKKLSFAIAVQLILEGCSVYSQCVQLPQTCAVSTGCATPITQFVIPAVIKPIVQDTCLQCAPNYGPDYGYCGCPGSFPPAPFCGMPPIIYDDGDDLGTNQWLYWLILLLSRRLGGYGGGYGGGCGGYGGGCGGGCGCGCGGGCGCGCGGCCCCGCGGCCCSKGHGGHGNGGSGCGCCCGCKCCCKCGNCCCCKCGNCCCCNYVPFPVPYPIHNSYEQNSNDASGCGDDCRDARINLVIKTLDGSSAPPDKPTP